MSRRDTIIISVLVNAALLVVLFTFAVTGREKATEDTKIVSSKPIAEISIDAKEMLFSDANTNQESSNIELASESKEFVALASEQKPIERFAEIPEPNVSYKLPQIAKNLDKKIPNPIDVNAFEITIKSGDNLEKLAHMYNTRVSEISKINNLSNSFLRIGQKILIPKTSFQNSLKPDVANQIKPEEKKQIVAAEYYTIKVGDNPYTIAIKHSIKPHELLKLNNLDERRAKRLKPGDKLRIR